MAVVFQWVTRHAFALVKDDDYEIASGVRWGSGHVSSHAQRVMTPYQTKIFANALIVLASGGIDEGSTIPEPFEVMA